VRDLAIHVPRVHGRHSFGKTLSAIRDYSAQHIVVAAAVRGVVFILLILLVVRADGQPLRSLGIAKQGLAKELLAATWMTVGAFAVMFVVAIPIAILGALTGTLEHESAQRTQTIGVIASQGTILEFVLAAIFAAAFEEIAFRSFLTPRMRAVVGSWPIAILVVSAIFGLGHVYEGAFATIQTAALGAYFAVMMLVRRRILGPALAHAAFNSIMLVIVRVLVQGHLLERLRAMSHH
jgi:membrane protease YdiL (CAAX protease family)